MTARVETAARVCECCGAEFERRRFPSGQLERVSQFAKRRFCSDGCYRKAAASGGKSRPVGRWIVEPYAQKSREVTVGDSVLSARATTAKHASQNAAPPPGAVSRACVADTAPQIPSQRTGETP